MRRGRCYWESHHPQLANIYTSRFLLVSLSIDGILHESTITRRREKPSKITNGLEVGDVYGATIGRIKAQDGDKSRLGMTALLWISHAERPPRSDELCHALAVQLGSTEFDVGNIPSMSTLVNCCQGLITVDKEASTVRLIHFTLQEYLSVHPDVFIKPHSAMAEICLTYLNSKQVKALLIAPSPDTQDASFLEYCSVCWGVHAKRELSECGRSLALELLKEDYSSISTELLLAHDNMYHKGYNFIPFSGLHCASFFGIVEVVTALIEVEGSDIDGEGFWGLTPLSCAAFNGHEEVVKALLERGEVDPEKAGENGRTPLFSAAWDGREGVVKILLGREEVNPDKADAFGRTPLLAAALNGHEGVVKILVEREEVNPDQPGRWGPTPLSRAAEKGHEGVVKILLEREGVNPDKPDGWGQTPLSHAAENGHEGVVKILLEREEVNLDKPDKYGRTPLLAAAQNGHEGVVKILLEREEVYPDKPDISGQTLLWHATWRGHQKVVALLKSRKAATPSTT